MQKQIAIASCHDKYNFGSALQAYATEEALRNMGCNVRTINKRGLSSEIGRGRRSYYLEHLFDYELYKAKMGFVNHKLRQRINREFGAHMHERYRSFAAFEREAFTFTEKKTSFDALADTVRGYDAVIVGSDQLWLPVNISGRYFTLEWVPKGVRRVSYATSFGVSKLSDNCLERTGRFLSAMDAVSVREETGADIVKRASGERCDVVCDPTLLIDRAEWKIFAARSGASLIPNEPYILCYFMGKNRWNRECALKLARRTGFKVVAIAHPDEYVRYDDGYADVYPWCAGPAEWVALVANAAYVCTDSFHCSLFSNMFEVPFFAFRRHEGMGSQSTNSRLDTLLNRVGSSDRICESSEEFDAAVLRDADFAEIRSNIAAYRDFSVAWLQRALLLNGRCS